MNLFLDSFWRALAYCAHPRIIVLSLLPLMLIVGLSLGLIFLFWDQALDGVRGWLTHWLLLESVLRWLESVGFANLRSVAAPLLVLVLALPLVIIGSLLAVAWLMTPALVNAVSRRRFPTLQRRLGGTFVKGVLISLGSSLLAVVAMILSIPLWFIPPLVLILPPLIWGWLTYRVMSYDVLAEHASEPERLELIERHRMGLIGIGVLTGYLGAAPGLIWAIGAVAIIFAPLLIPLAIWIYTFVFVFSALWFAHYCLAALEALRAEPIDVASVQRTAYDDERTI